MLYGRCTNVLSRYHKHMQSDSITIRDIHQQLNNIEVYHIYIFNIAEYNSYRPVIQSKINNVS